MIQGYEIIRQVHEKFSKICYKMAALTGKHYETFSSHGREPKTHNPLSSGNVSPLDHFMTYCRQHEAAERGAGLMMIRRAASELELEFTGEEIPQSPQKLLDKLLTEFSDVAHELNNCDKTNWRRSDYAHAEIQCDELSEIAQDCKAKFRKMEGEQK